MMAATVGKVDVGRITGDPQLAKLAEHQIKKAAVKTKRHLMCGKRVSVLCDGSFPQGYGLLQRS